MTDQGTEDAGGNTRGSLLSAMGHLADAATHQPLPPPARTLSIRPIMLRRLFPYQALLSHRPQGRVPMIVPPRRTSRVTRLPLLVGALLGVLLLGLATLGRWDLAWRSAASGQVLAATRWRSGPPSTCRSSPSPALAAVPAPPHRQLRAQHCLNSACICHCLSQALRGSQADSTATRRSSDASAAPVGRQHGSATQQGRHKADKAVRQRCKGTLGSWCEKFLTQEPVPAVAAPRGNETCNLDCNGVSAQGRPLALLPINLFDTRCIISCTAEAAWCLTAPPDPHPLPCLQVGTCSALTGLCTCPAGAHGCREGSVDPAAIPCLLVPGPTYMGALRCRPPLPPTNPASSADFAGWTGFNCLHPQKRYCTHRFRMHGFDPPLLPPDLEEGIRSPDFWSLPFGRCAGG